MNTPAPRPRSPRTLAPPRVTARPDPATPRRVPGSAYPTRSPRCAPPISRRRSPRRELPAWLQVAHGGGTFGERLVEPSGAARALLSIGPA